MQDYAAEGRNHGDHVKILSTQSTFKYRILLFIREIFPSPFWVGWSHPKGNQSWIFIGRWWRWTPILGPPNSKNWHWKRPWCWERLKAGGEGDNRWWDGWMASPTPWTWVWVGSRSCWWTGKPGMLQSMGSQRVRHYWVTKMNWTEAILKDKIVNFLQKFLLFSCCESLHL